MNIRRPTVFLISALIVFCSGASAASAQVDQGRVAWETGIAHLFNLNQGRETAVDPDKLGGLFDFILSSAQKEGVGCELNPSEGAPGVSFVTDVEAPLTKILRYAYNTDVPAHLVLPSVVRLSGWLTGPQGPSRQPWERLGKANEPLLLRGAEYEEITPDLTTGAYYRYDMDRLMLLVNHRGHDFFLSVAKQRGTSTVGKKGAVIGPDSDWNYFYSGQKGLSKTGLGWVSSYLYSASSVAVFYEPTPNRPRTRLVTFKWLNAGWGGINMVKAKDIIEGCRRFASGFEKVLESPRLLPAEHLAAAFLRIKAMSEAELDASLRPASQKLQALAKSDPNLSRREFRELIETGRYLRSMTRQEREHLLLTESFKFSLGRPSLVERPL